MQYNKLFGLELLHRALGGRGSARAIEYHVLRKPSEFDAKKFLKHERLLLRTNLDGQLAHEAWAGLPRGEALRKHANYAEVPVMLTGLKQSMSVTFGADPQTFHYIISPVLERKKYDLHGHYVNTGYVKNKLRLSSNTGAKVFRGTVSRAPYLEFIGPKTIVKKVGKEKADFVYARLSEALEKIQAEAQASGVKNWEASFTIRGLKGGKPIIEFFDFLDRGLY